LLACDLEGRPKSPLSCTVLRPRHEQELATHPVQIGIPVTFAARTSFRQRFVDDPEADVVLAGLSPEAAASLEDGFRARLRGVDERIELRVAEKLVNPLLRAAIAAGAEVVSVTPHRMSLESIFLSAVEEDRARSRRAGGEERT